MTAQWDVFASEAAIPRDRLVASVAGTNEEVGPVITVESRVSKWPHFFFIL